MIKPAQEKPGKLKACIFISVTKTVRIYKRIAFEKKENIPKVTMLRGREIRLKMGLRVIPKIVKNIPPRAKTLKPPVMVTPSSACPRRKRDKPLIDDALRNDFISIRIVTDKNFYCQFP